MTERTRTTLEPDEAFIGALEQQLRDGIRRRARLDPSDPAPTRTRRKEISMLNAAQAVFPEPVGAPIRALLSWWYKQWKT